MSLPLAERQQFREGIDFLTDVKGRVKEAPLPQHDREVLGTLGISLLGLLRFQDFDEITSFVRTDKKALAFLVKASQDGHMERYLEDSKASPVARGEEFLNTFGLYALSNLSTTEVGNILWHAPNTISYRVNRVSRSLWAYAPKETRKRFDNRNPLKGRLYPSGASRQSIESALEDLRRGKPFDAIERGYNLSRKKVMKIRRRLKGTEEENLLVNTYPENHSPYELRAKRILEAEGAELKKLLAQVDHHFLIRDGHAEQPIFMPFSAFLKRGIRVVDRRVVLDVLREAGIPAVFIEVEVPRKARNTPLRYYSIMARDLEEVRKLLGRNGLTRELTIKEKTKGKGGRG